MERMQAQPLTAGTAGWFMCQGIEMYGDQFPVFGLPVQLGPAALDQNLCDFRRLLIDILYNITPKLIGQRIRILEFENH